MGEVQCPSPIPLEEHLGTCSSIKSQDQEVMKSRAAVATCGRDEKEVIVRNHHETNETKEKAPYLSLSY